MERETGSCYRDFLHNVLRKKAVKNASGWRKIYLYDVIRRKWVRATPEEQVRQYTLHVLIEKGHPKGRISVERKFRSGKVVFAVDILVHGQVGEPLVVIECKRGDVPLSDKDLLQASFYKKHLGTPCFVISNGHEHVCYLWQKGKGAWAYWTDIPDSATLSGKTEGASSRLRGSAAILPH